MNLFFMDFLAQFQQWERANLRYQSTNGSWSVDVLVNDDDTVTIHVFLNMKPAADYKLDGNTINLIPLVKWLHNQVEYSAAIRNVGSDGA